MSNHKFSVTGYRLATWKKKLASCFLIISVSIYLIHYMIFKDFYYISKFLIAQLGFLPISTLIVGIVINQFMANRQKEENIEKINKIISVFFREVGQQLINIMKEFQVNQQGFYQNFDDIRNWTEEDFHNMKIKLLNQNYQIDINLGNLEKLKAFLHKKRAFITNMLENQNLLEHDQFTDLIWTILHIDDELTVQEHLDILTKEDIEHFTADILRSYKLLIIEWINHMKHIKDNYPYLFSLAVRTLNNRPLEIKEDQNSI